MFVTLLSLLHMRTRGADISADAGNLGAWSLNLAVAGVAVVWMTPVYHWFFYQRVWQPLPDVWWAYVLAVVCYDFLYYWFHRASHTLRPLWNVHSVHHQATRLVPSLGLRSSVFDFAVLWLIAGPLFWLGFGTEMLIFSVAIHGLYQVFLHNEWDIRLGSLGWILNTPAHHRLHHATNPQYLDKNFGSILIIWDRLFGTFVQETEKPEIGIIGRNSPGDPLTANLHPWLGRWWPDTQPTRAAAGLCFAAVVFLVSSLMLQFPAWVTAVVVVMLMVTVSGLSLIRKPG